ncbi:MAG: hypothetical protein ACK4L7_09740, partial [Flavobacteriales bacterium]
MSHRPGAQRIATAAACLLIGGCAWSQTHHLVLLQADSASARRPRAQKLASAEAVPNALSQQLALLHGQGHLEASIDSCLSHGDTTTCLVHAGRIYRWARLSGHGIPVEIASQARFREKLYEGAPVSPRQVQRLQEDLLRLCEDNGFPFAWTRLDSLRETADGLQATVRLERGRQVRIDSVLVKGTARTNERFLQAHIGIRPGDLYNESL